MDYSEAVPLMTTPESIAPRSRARRGVSKGAPGGANEIESWITYGDGVFAKVPSRLVFRSSFRSRGLKFLCLFGGFCERHVRCKLHLKD
jgi:hypothetical protein